MMSVGNVFNHLPPKGREPLKPVTHGGAGYFPSRTASPPLDRQQIILLGDRGTRANYEQLAHSCYMKPEEPRLNPRPFESQVQRSNHYITTPHTYDCLVSNKPVFSFIRELTTRHCSHLLLNAVLLSAVVLRRLSDAAVDRYLLPAGPTAANPPQRRAAAE